MNRVSGRDELRQAVTAAHGQRRTIGFVPTMGFLHEGHLSLVDRTRALTDFVVVSIFVNPLQFGPGEDLERYPRDVERDAALLSARGTDLLFTPGAATLYPDGEPGVYVDAPALSDRLCGAHRPGHFRGVLTVVAKLFNLVSPDVAVFGRKDFQQLVLIRRMVRDLDFPVRIEGAPIVRETDGLAMSSRNVYLEGIQREQATLLNRALLAAEAAFAAGERAPARLIAIARNVLAEGSAIRPQYVELVRPDTLDAPHTATAGDVLALAAFVGETRLIDNRALGAEDG